MSMMDGDKVGRVTVFMKDSRAHSQSNLMEQCLSEICSSDHDTPPLREISDLVSGMVW